MVAAARLLPFEHLPCMAHSLQRTVTVSLKDSGLERRCNKMEFYAGDGKEDAEKQISTDHYPGAAKEQGCHGELAKLQKLEELLEPCRYVTELLGGEQYVSCSVVLPALRHLFRVMEPSDDDPVYVLRFKKAFTTDLAQRKDSTNLKWLKITTALDPRFKDLKCLTKDERSEVWASVRDLMMRETRAQQPPAETTEEPSPKKRRRMSILLCSFDSDTDDEEESIEHYLDRYKAEPKMDIEGCPLQWWSKREGAHARLAPIARKYRNWLNVKKD
ncbi:hypothetical protein JOQ06_028842 [Pogonophryne albipinna]|uniref:HAT C-terminal dimerisation domain-containing protein n=1 Tax=Pogonophryne albipinna TaxID=1090488 RepID=A0AAD6B9R6_9TELE|nr:hypothetical protein JOQ06_028842 [Pogonophryne albipinna]